MIKQKVNMKSIKSIISVVVSLMLLIAATIAWFVLQSRASIDGLDAGAANEEFVVATEQNGAQIEVGDDSLSFTMDRFVNVADQKMAPGTSGKFDLWVRTSSNAVTKFIIRLDNSEMKFDVGEAGGTTEGGSGTGSGETGGTTENASETQTGEGSGTQTDTYDYSAMLRNHIKFYKDEAYTEELTYDNPVTGELEPNKPVKVTIYWKWMYDGEEYLEKHIFRGASPSFNTITKLRNKISTGDLVVLFIQNDLKVKANKLINEGKEDTYEYKNIYFTISQLEYAKQLKEDDDADNNGTILSEFIIDYYLNNWDLDDNYISKNKDKLLGMISFEAFGTTDDGATIQP